MKLPPLEKILEAWSAIGAGRIRLLSPPDADSGEALVDSSDASKSYMLSWDGHTYRSTDNATVWQAYPGYPVLALLMLQGLLPLPQEYAKLLASVNWHKLNKEARGNYAQAASEAFKALGLDEEKRAEILRKAEETYALLPSLDISVGRYRKAPPNKSE